MSSPSSVVWIAREVVLAIHEQVLADHGGRPGIRDEGLLDSALARPISAAHYGEPDLAELAALYAIAISRNHPFLDGNKRVAFVLLELFLELNGRVLAADDAEAIAMMWSLASGSETDVTFIDWVRSRTVET